SLHDYTLRHGDAVAMGMVLAAELSQVLGLAPQAMVEEHYELVAQLGLPARHRVRDFGSAIELMGRDKKARGGVIRFILLRGPGDAVAVDGVDVGDLTRAMTRCLDSEDR
ncbi:MAG: 3-dehydroquinate synthase, partial [Actinobacteria bacterium]|nr:3-dehydroquinate synthase [Actinomycetota bacterium]